ncbi:hypothetical protein [Streptomyces sp. NPDC059398]|uniref:hypothetical protein n=1 Tax=Streptomyces sp. NPDC059398 TaxID=3346820 RepID=UPI00367A3378
MNHFKILQFPTRASRIAAAILFMAAVVMSVLGGSVSAHAAVADVECTPTTSTLSVSYNPGLHLETQSHTITTQGNYQCLSSSDSTLSSGGFGPNSATGVSASCLQLLPSGTGSFTITWNNGRTSTITASVTNTVVANTYVSTGIGTVTAGEFAGDAVLAVNIFIQPNLLACLSTAGVTNMTGTANLLITSA